MIPIIPKNVYNFIDNLNSEIKKSLIKKPKVKNNSPIKKNNIRIKKTHEELMEIQRNKRKKKWKCKICDKSISIVQKNNHLNSNYHLKRLN